MTINIGKYRFTITSYVRRFFADIRHTRRHARWLHVEGKGPTCKVLCTLCNVYLGAFPGLFSVELSIKQ